jgi:hypothetical protein
VGIAPGIQDDAIRISRRFLEGIDQIPLVIRLLVRDGMVRMLFPEGREVRSESLRTVGFRLPASQQVKVRAIDNQNVHSIKKAPTS